MCGFTGYWTFSPCEITASSKVIEQMSSMIIHRGPDSHGSWVDTQNGVVLGHRRLSILDLSSSGHQPMISPSGRYVISYNGELYNIQELKKFLQPINATFKGTSDTELLLHACEYWGVEKTIEKCNGMFAFALWDTHDKCLYLARDRLGKKPLYWGFVNNILFFGSQLKSFYKHPAWKGSINQTALASFFAYNYIPSPQSIYNEINKLEAGCWVRIDSEKHCFHNRYWNLNEIALKNAKASANISTNNVLLELEDLLKDAVKNRMVADVPLGAFLSGGIDSSLITAVMQTLSPNPVKTFSIGFKEIDFDEAMFAKKIANHLGTEHHELYLGPEDSQRIILDLPEWYDEPFADSSQIPTYLISSFAKKYVTVSLSGDGGDELFAGYNRYFWTQKIWNKMKYVPSGIRYLLANGVLSVPPFMIDKIARLCPKIAGLRQVGDKAHKFANLLKSEDEKKLYQQLITFWQQPLELLPELKDFRFPHTSLYSESLGYIENMQLVDSLTYLPDDILTKVDRASMAVSLEVRAPLLDYRLVEFAWLLPLSLKIHQGKGKWILRKLLAKYVPTELFERPKMGFGIPIADWLRNSMLRDWAEELLSVKNLEMSGLNSMPVRIKWQEHLTGKRNWQYLLWGILMYQSWFKHWIAA